MQKKEVLPYAQAREYIRSLNLSNQKDHNAWFKLNKPEKIASNPSVTYHSSGWVSWSDYLGNANQSTINRTYLSYQDAVDKVKAWGIASKDEWYRFTKENELPLDIPKRADYIYKTAGWSSWSNFLSNNRFSKHQMKSYDEAVAIVQSIGFDNMYEYLDWIEQEGINYLPKRPDFVYADHWSGWLNFLGYERKISTGENIIKKYLERHLIDYRREVAVADIKARFDFHLPAYNIYIEYDGVHHFKSVNHFGDFEYFQKTKLQDSIKNDWCRSNGHTLIRIGYQDIKKIGDILNKALGIKAE